MSRSSRRGIFIPLLLCALALGLLIRSSGLEAARTVDALLLFSAGLCAGVALKSLLGSRGS